MKCPYCQNALTCDECKPKRIFTEADDEIIHTEKVIGAVPSVSGVNKLQERIRQLEAELKRSDESDRIRFDLVMSHGAELLAAREREREYRDALRNAGCLMRERNENSSVTCGCWTCAVLAKHAKGGGE